MQYVRAFLLMTEKQLKITCSASCELVASTRFDS